METLAFIGGGNMAASIIGGLLANGYCAQKIWVSSPNQAKLNALSSRFLGIHTTQDNNIAVQQASIVLLCVKPNKIRSVAMALAPVVHASQPLVISVAAGVGMHALQQWLGEDVAIVRCMPNTPSLIGEGVTGAFANSVVSESQKIAASTILSTIGKWLWLIDEKYMDAVTALSGCGPAYFFLVMEALIKAGEQLGLSHDDARTLTLQTALGAAHMAIASTEDVAQLRQQVMSPGGVTEKAIHVFESGGLQSLFSGALHAAHQRAKELAVEFCE